MADQATVDGVLATIRSRESGGDYNAHASGSSASGAYQYINSTWQAEAAKAGVNTSLYPTASSAPASIQDKVAANNVANILDANNGNIAAVPNVWYTGNAAGNMSAAQLAANNGLTSQQYSDAWIRDYNAKTGGTVVTNPNGSQTAFDKNGNVVNPVVGSQGFGVYTGGEQQQVITSMKQLEELDSNWEENSLDSYSDYIYNLELFLVDNVDTNDFLNKVPPIDIENNSWPYVGMKKVVIAKTGETAEFVITDLSIDSISVGGSSSPNATIANAATALSFNITRVGNARLGDAIQDAVMLAGYPDVSIANFFIKIIFTKIDNTGVATSVPNATKVIPFRLAKVIDLSTSTDQKGTTATLEGAILRNYGATTPDVAQLKYKITSQIDKNSADNTISNFFIALNKTIIQNSHGNGYSYNLTYHYKKDKAFGEKYPTLTLMDTSGVSNGNAGNTVNTRANSAYQTINTVTQTLEVPPTTSILDVLQDILINTSQLKSQLTNPNISFSDLFSIDVEYIPKNNGYNILTKTEGADVYYTICLKKEIIEHNVLNQIDQLQNINAIMKDMIDSGRIKKKYYYYYTGRNDQIMQFDITLDRMLMKAQNEEYDVYYDVNQVNSVETMLSELKIVSDERLQQLRGDFSRAKGDFSSADAKLTSAKNTYASEVKKVKKNFFDILTANTGMPPAAIDAVVSNYFDGVDIYADGSDGSISIDQAISDLEAETGLANETTETAALIASMKSLRDAVKKAREEYDIAKAKVDTMTTDITDDVKNTVGVALSDAARKYGMGDSTKMFEKAGVTSNIATLEDLGSDLRRKITPVELAGILNFLSVSAARFINVAVMTITDPPNAPKFFMSGDQKRVELARLKYVEGWQQDLSMINATIKIKGDPYWVQNYITPDVRSSTYGNNNYRPNNVSNTVGSNFAMIVTNALDGIDDTGQPKVANLFRYIYIVKSIKSEFSSGLFTQTLDMVKFHLADTFEPKPDAPTHHPEPLGGEDYDSTPTTRPENPPVSTGNSITVHDTQIPIDETNPHARPSPVVVPAPNVTEIPTQTNPPTTNGTPIVVVTPPTITIAGNPVGDVLTARQMAAIQISLSMGNTYPQDIMNKYNRQKNNNQGRP